MLSPLATLQISMIQHYMPFRSERCVLISIKSEYGQKKIGFGPKLLFVQSKQQVNG